MEPINLLNCQLNSSVEDTTYEKNDTQSQLNEKTTNQLLNLQELIVKRSEILSKANNDPEIEQDFRRTCSLFESQNSASDPALSKVYQEYIDAYHKITSLYNMEYDWICNTYVYVYDTENEVEKDKELWSWQKLDLGTCIAQIPNCELFCIGKVNPYYGFSLIIDKNNLKTRLYLSGTLCCYSSAIYFNRNIYCFGGEDENQYDLTLSERFDLDKNCWFKLTPMPWACSKCSSAIFGRDILISTDILKNIMIYSIDADSFSEIDYNFAINKRKILLNAKERMYLIEADFDGGLIYESQVGDAHTWKQIGNSIINENPQQIYSLYNKGGFYISAQLYDEIKYYKFDLDQKIMIELQSVNIIYF